MNIDDLIEGESIIYGEFKNNSNRHYITYFTKNDDAKSYCITIEDNNFHNGNGCIGYPRFTPLRYANNTEVLWFKECIKQGKYVPIEEIVTEEYYNIKLEF